MARHPPQRESRIKGGRGGSVLLFVVGSNLDDRNLCLGPGSVIDVALDVIPKYGVADRCSTGRSCCFGLEILLLILIGRLRDASTSSLIKSRVDSFINLRCKAKYTKTKSSPPPNRMRERRRVLVVVDFIIVLGAMRMQNVAARVTTNSSAGGALLTVHCCAVSIDRFMQCIAITKHPPLDRSAIRSNDIVQTASSSCCLKDSGVGRKKFESKSL